MKELNVILRTETDLIATDVPSSRILEIEITAPESTKKRESAPLNLALVIDRSGSMGGGKLEQAKAAVSQILELMSERDSVSVIAYDDTVSHIGSCQSVTGGERQELQAALNHVHTGGSTNLGDGWLQGCDSVARWMEPGKVNRSLLLSDGLANVGITSIEELTHHAAQIFERGVATTTFGIGRDFNQELLNGMSNRGGGNFYFIENTSQIPELLMQEFKDLASVTARDVVVELNVPSGVSAELFGEWRHEQKLDHLTIRLSDLPANRTLNLFVKLLTPPGKGKLVMGTVVTGFDEEGKTFELTSEIVFKYASQEKVREAVKDKGVQERFSSVVVGQKTNVALKLEKEGKRSEAKQMMDQIMLEHAANLPLSTKERYLRISRDIQGGFEEMDRKRMNFDSYQLEKHRHNEQLLEEMKRRREQENKPKDGD